MTNEQRIIQMICSCCFEISSTINMKMKYIDNYFEFRTLVDQIFEEEYCTLPQWMELERSLEKDTVINEGRLALGNYSSPRQICNKIFFDSLITEDDLIYSQAKSAYNSFFGIIGAIQNQRVKHSICVRLYGIEIESDMVLSEDILLVSLSDMEIADRENVLHSFSEYFENPKIHRTELEIGITIPINLNEESSLPKTIFTAFDISEDLIDDFIMSLYMLKSGEVLVGTKVIYGGLSNRLTKVRDLTRNMLNTNIKLVLSDTIPLHGMFILIKEARKSDNILRRAFSRFVMARARASLEDSLIDYVICLESICLTENKSSITSELAYRFSLNGSTLLWRSSLKLDRRKAVDLLKNIYEIRSKIVHGGSTDKINNTIAKTGFSDLISLNNYIDECIRHIIVWLVEMGTESRPYNFKGGWEELMWNPPK